MDNDVQENPKKLFVGNVSFNTSEDQLRELFAEYGTITQIKLVTDRYTGRSRGIAFVEFETEDEAAAAIEALHEYEFDGRNLVVNVARPPRPRSEYRGGNNRGGDRRGGYNRDNRGGYNRDDRGGYSNRRSGDR